MMGVVEPAHIELELVQLQRLEIASFIEATTLVVLLGIASPLKHFGGQPLGVTIMGPVHGIAFCYYLWTVVQTIAGGDWSRREWARLVITAFVPIAGYFNLPLIRRKMNALRSSVKG